MFDIYLVDCSGSGDVDTSKTANINADGTLTGLSGRTLKVNQNWDNADGTFRLGLKFGYDLYPADLKSRIKVCWLQIHTELC